MRQLTTRGWLLTHALAISLIVVFLYLGRWQWHRAESGNTQSYAYALEWPTFALLVIGFWIKIVREVLRPKIDPDATCARPDDDAAELAAYNRYVAERARLREERAL